MTKKTRSPADYAAIQSLEDLDGALPQFRLASLALESLERNLMRTKDSDALLGLSEQARAIATAMGAETPDQRRALYAQLVATILVDAARSRLRLGPAIALVLSNPEQHQDTT